MSKLIVDGKETTIKKGQQIMDVNDELGLISYACRMGACMVCAVTVKKGGGALNPLTNDEKNLGGNDTHRLACKLACTDDKAEIVLTTGWV